MPLAQNLGSASAPGISLRIVSENSPCTVEILTPTFSKTRPFITDISPPPPASRFHFVRWNFVLPPEFPSENSMGRSSGLARPADRASLYSFSMVSNSVQMESRRVRNQSAAFVFCSSNVIFSFLVILSKAKNLQIFYEILRLRPCGLRSG